MYRWGWSYSNLPPSTTTATKSLHTQYFQDTSIILFYITKIQIQYFKTNCLVFHVLINRAATFIHTAIKSHFLSAQSPQAFNAILIVTSLSGSSAALGEAAIMFITAQDLFPAFETLFPVCAHQALIFSHHLHSNAAAPQWDSQSMHVP